MDEFKRWKLCRLAQLECLINFFDKSSLQRIIENIQSQGGNHSECCLEMLNYLNQANSRDKITPEKMRKNLEEYIVNELKKVMIKASNTKEVFIEMLSTKTYNSIYLGNVEVKQEIQSKTIDFSEKIKASSEHSQQEETQVENIEIPEKNVEKENLEVQMKEVSIIS